jgi:hypothetical protein
LKPELWRSPLVQGKCQEEKAWDKRHPYRIIIIIIINNNNNNAVYSNNSLLMFQNNLLVPPSGYKKSKRDHSITEVNRNNLLFWDFVHRLSTAFCFCFQAKKHLTWLNYSQSLGTTDMVICYDMHLRTDLAHG